MFLFFKTSELLWNIIYCIKHVHRLANIETCIHVYYHRSLKQNGWELMCINKIISIKKTHRLNISLFKELIWRWKMPISGPYKRACWFRLIKLNSNRLVDISTTYWRAAKKRCHKNHCMISVCITHQLKVIESAFEMSEFIRLFTERGTYSLFTRHNIYYLKGSTSKMSWSLHVILAYL